jgi:hypothetical protein
LKFEKLKRSRDISDLINPYYPQNTKNTRYGPEARRLLGHIIGNQETENIEKMLSMIRTGHLNAHCPPIGAPGLTQEFLDPVNGQKRCRAPIRGRIRNSSPNVQISSSRDTTEPSTFDSSYASNRSSRAAPGGLPEPFSRSSRAAPGGLPEPFSRSSRAAPDASSFNVKVLSYNVSCEGMTGNPTKKPSQAVSVTASANCLINKCNDNVIKFITSHAKSHDFIGIQEASELRLLQSQLPNHFHLYHVSGQEDSLLYYNKKKYTLIASKNSEIRRGRTVTMGVFKHIKTKTVFAVINLHAPPSGTNNIMFNKLYNELTSQLVNTYIDHIIVMGDFNKKNQSVVINGRTLEEGSEHKYTCCDHSFENTTAHSYQADHIYVSDAFSVKNEFPLNKKWHSDHKPVEAIIRITPVQSSRSSRAAPHASSSSRPAPHASSSSRAAPRASSSSRPAPRIQNCPAQFEEDAQIVKTCTTKKGVVSMIYKIHPDYNLGCKDLATEKIAKCNGAFKKNRRNVRGGTKRADELYDYVDHEYNLKSRKPPIRGAYWQCPPENQADLKFPYTLADGTTICLKSDPKRGHDDMYNMPSRISMGGLGMYETGTEEKFRELYNMYGDLDFDKDTIDRLNTIYTSNIGKKDFVQELSKDPVLRQHADMFKRHMTNDKSLLIGNLALFDFNQAKFPSSYVNTLATFKEKLKFFGIPSEMTGGRRGAAAKKRRAKARKAKKAKKAPKKKAPKKKAPKKKAPKKKAPKKKAPKKKAPKKKPKTKKRK